MVIRINKKTMEKQCNLLYKIEHIQDNNASLQDITLLRGIRTFLRIFNPIGSEPEKEMLEILPYTE